MIDRTLVRNTGGTVDMLSDRDISEGR